MPLELHEARGTARRDRHATEDSDKAQPQPATTGLDLGAPPHLSAEARKEWQHKAGMLNRLGLLSEVDMDALALYCAAMATWKKAERHLRREGWVLRGKTGHRTPNPWVAIGRSAFEQLHRLQTEFGLTPSARTRVTVLKKKGTDQQKDRFFGGTNPATRSA